MDTIRLIYLDGYYIGYIDNEGPADIYTSSGQTAKEFLLEHTHLDDMMAKLIVCDMSLGYIVEISFKAK